MNIPTSPTNVGNRPYEDDGTARQTTDGPVRLRERLRAHVLCDVKADYRDFARPLRGIRESLTATSSTVDDEPCIARRRDSAGRLTCGRDEPGLPKTVFGARPRSTLHGASLV
jgi:hypothetical protein